ncbi:MAG: DUF58 domain-containing protein [Gaiellaceae bacterium]
MSQQRISPTEAERVARTLELAVTRRLDGLLRGQYLGVLPGPGWDVGEARSYIPGDDVRRIDWNLSARTDEVQVRDTIVEWELEATLAVDLSPTIAFGTALYEKRDLALAAAAAVGFLATKTGGRLGGVLLEAGGEVIVPQRSGRRHVVGLIKQLAASRPADGTGRSDLAAGLRSVGRIARRRGLVCVISDFLADGAWERELRALSQRHEVLAVEVVDPRELELPDIGDVAFVDPASGERLTVATSNSELRERYAAAAAKQRLRIATAIAGAGASHLSLRTDRDWVREIVEFVALRRRIAVHRPGPSA